MRALLEALFVRSEPEKLCCGIAGAPHAIAILLGEIIERNQDWRAEVSSQDPGARSCRFSGFLSSHLVGESVRGGHRAGSSEGNKKGAPGLV